MGRENENLVSTAQKQPVRGRIPMYELRKNPDHVGNAVFEPLSNWRFLSEVRARSGANLKMMDGVFLRCLSSILGIIMFLRLGFMISYSGVFGSISVVLIASVLTFLTTLSLSAIATNGEVRSGGVYFMISRSLGAEFGGSIGVLFYLANAVNVSLYCLGFAETVKHQILSENKIILFSESMDEQFIALMALVCCFIVCMVGVSWVVRTEKVLLYFLLFSVLLIASGSIAGPVARPENFSVLNKTVADYSSRRQYIPGFQKGQLGNNFWSQYDGPATFIGDPLDPAFQTNNTNITIPLCTNQPTDSVKEEYGIVTFAVVLSVFFPAVSGIMAGASVSGELKNPNAAIPTGTLSAIIVSALIYITLIICVGSNGVRSVIIAARVKTAGEYFCEFGGLFHEALLPVKMAFLPAFCYIGIYAATLSSALTALVSAPGVLQAIAKDNLFPAFAPLAKTVGPKEEPIRAYLVTFCIAAACILTGNINSVAPLITTFFLLSYALVNYACFAADSSGSPGWRPSFQYYSQTSALCGAVGCVSVVLLLSAVTGFVTFVIGLALYKYIETSRNDSKVSRNWGAPTNARQINSALGAILALERFSEAPKTYEAPELSQTFQAFEVAHVRNFRPNFLVLCGQVGRSPELCFFANEFRKCKGLNIFAEVLVGDSMNADLLQKRNSRAIFSYLKEYNVKGFNEVLLTDNFRSGVRSLLQLSGLGRVLKPNTVLIGFKNMQKATNLALSEYVGALQDCFDFGFGVAVLRNGSKIFDQDVILKTAENANASLSLFPQNDVSHTDDGSGMVSHDVDHENETPLKEIWMDFKSFAIKPIQRSCFSNKRESEVSIDIESDIENLQLENLQTKRIDVYWFADDGGLTLLLPHLLRQATNPPFVGCELRVIAVGRNKLEAEQEERSLKKLLKKLRIPALLQIVSLELVLDIDSKSAEDNLGVLKSIGKLIAATSASALLVVCTLPVPNSNLSAEGYLEQLEVLSNHHASTPFLLTRGSHRPVLTISS